MKTYFIFALLLLCFSASAQPKKTPQKKSATTSVSSLKTLNDSASYAIGLSVAKFYAQQGMTKLNVAMITKAINDVMAGKTALLDDQQTNNTIMRFMNKSQESKAKPTIAAGQQFLTKNKSKTGVKTTASGLQYEVLVEGKGPKPTLSDSVTVNYMGTLINGNEFDNSYKRGQPITFPITGVIRGWTEALQLMSVGSKYKLYIPHDLAYGPNDYSSIPGGSVLIFEVELLGIPGKN